MKENNGAVTPAAQTRVNDLRKIILDIRGTDIGEEIEKDSFCVIPRLFVDNSYVGFHVVVQVWDHKAPEQERHWNFSLWLFDVHHGDEDWFVSHPDDEYSIHCEMVHDLGDVWFTRRDSLLTIAEHLASYNQRSFK